MRESFAAELERAAACAYLFHGLASYPPINDCHRYFPRSQIEANAVELRRVVRRGNHRHAKSRNMPGYTPGEEI